MTNQDRTAFGSRLKEQREARSLSLSDLAKLTKVPERSLERLEAGAFEDLPAEVFVRGFLRSYCRAVGLDAEEMTRSYGEIVLRERGKREYSLARPGVVPEHTPHETPVARAAAAERAERAERDEPRQADAQRNQKDKPDKPVEETSAIFQAISEAGRGGTRISLTLAVIILVIIATLTLSVLLRRPNHVGDGVSSLDPERVSCKL
jgi:transcriptional regulator with XRE-family HTH domain